MQRLSYQHSPRAMTDAEISGVWCNIIIVPGRLRVIMWELVLACLVALACAQYPQNSSIVLLLQSTGLPASATGTNVNNWPDLSVSRSPFAGACRLVDARLRHVGRVPIICVIASCELLFLSVLGVQRPNCLENARVQPQCV